MRRMGFTLIELLVVIAIIGILAAMLFPVFARARESARKIQCLSNVKNIAMAMQMYFTDYDKFPPAEVNANVNGWFETCGGNTTPGCCSTQANPYLRWPVILDEYIKNRDVWRCPSAKRVTYAGAIIPGPDWFKQFSQSGKLYGACCDLWPVGWGGTATDTDMNTCYPGQKPGADTKAVEFGIGMFEHLQGQSISVVHDVSKHVIVSDSPGEPWWGQAEQLAYPDICRARWGADIDWECGAQWENADCSDSQDCGISVDAIDKFWNDPTYRNKYARHLGGSNVGFADGHARWWPAASIISAAGNYNNPSPYATPIQGAGRSSPPGGGTGTEFLEGVTCWCIPQSQWK